MGTAESENEDDGARNFIRATLDQDFNKARQYMVNDTLNNEFMDATERQFSKMSSVEKRNYQDASIQGYQKRFISDSVAIIYYSNSYKNRKDSVKAVKVDGKWLIDLKYSFPRRNPKP